MNNLAIHSARSQLLASQCIALAKSQCASLSIAERLSDRWSRADANRSRRNTPVPDTMEYLIHGFERLCETARQAMQVIAELKLGIALCELRVMLEAESARKSGVNGVDRSSLHARLADQLAFQATALEQRLHGTEKHISEIDQRLENLQARMHRFYPVAVESVTSGVKAASSERRAQLAN